VVLLLKQATQVTLSIKDNSGSFATYYTDADRISGTDFDDDGITFTLNKDGAIKGGFYLTSTQNTYSITKFDLTHGGKTYELKGNVSLTVTKGKTDSVPIALAEKKEGSVTGTAFTGTSATKEQESDTKHFDFTLQKSDGTLFSTDDMDYIINLEVKDGDKPLYSIPNLFNAIGEAKGKQKNGGAEIFTITLPKELSSYSGGGANLNIEGTCTKDKVTKKLSKVSVKDLKHEKENTIIQAYTAAGVNQSGKGTLYPNGSFEPQEGKGSRHEYEIPSSIPDNIKINVGEDKTIQLLKLDDKHKYNVYCQWNVYRLEHKKPLLEYSKFQSSRSGSPSYSTKLGKINPYDIDIERLKPDLHDFITEDLKNFYLEVTVQFKDDKGKSKIAKSPQVKKYYYYFKNSEKVHYLGKVKFIPRVGGDTNDKVKLIIKDNKGNLAKYYTEEDKIKGTLFDNKGTEFTLGFIEDGVYLEDTMGVEYRITKFDLTSGGINYKLKGTSVVVPSSREQVFVDLVKKQ